ncbi:MAG TPA: hypothetical protein VLF93_01230 [Candidatus Saccharimonadales bacterium]|nr:hypothetical protein [Candidatus Saccharimonadales bacterium]
MTSCEVFIGHDILHSECAESGVQLEVEPAKQIAIEILESGGNIVYDKDATTSSGYRIAVLRPIDGSASLIATIGYHQTLTEPPEKVGIRMLFPDHMVDVVIENPNNPDQRIYSTIHEDDGTLARVSQQGGIFFFPLYLNAIPPSQYKQTMSYVNQQMKNLWLDRKQTDYQTELLQNYPKSS